MKLKQEAMSCVFKNNWDIPCGRLVPMENNHSQKLRMSFVEFSTHGLCHSHASLVLEGQRDPEILALLMHRRGSDE